MATVHIPVIPPLAPVLLFAFCVWLYISLSILLLPFKKMLHLVHWAVVVKPQIAGGSRISPDITGMRVFSIVKHLCRRFFATGLCDVTKSDIMGAWSATIKPSRLLLLALGGQSSRSIALFTSMLIKLHYQKWYKIVLNLRIYFKTRYLVTDTKNDRFSLVLFIYLFYCAE